MKLRTQILLVFLIIIKLILGSIFMYRVGLDPLSIGAEAIASEHQEDKEVEAQKDENNAKEELLDLNFLLKKKSELEAEEERIKKEREKLSSIKEDINVKIGELAQLRDEIRADMAQKEAIKDQKFKHLVKVYSSMKPQSAAGIIEKLDIELAVKLLCKMKGDNVGKILSFVEKDKAAKISIGIVEKQE